MRKLVHTINLSVDDMRAEAEQCGAFTLQSMHDVYFTYPLHGPYTARQRAELDARLHDVKLTARLAFTWAINVLASENALKG